MTDMLNEIIKDWSWGTLEYGSTVDYPQVVNATFDVSGLTKQQYIELTDEFLDSLWINFNVGRATRFQMLPAEIVGVTVGNGSVRKFTLSYLQRLVPVSDVLKGFKLSDDEKKINAEVDLFFNRLNEMKESKK
ncbi:hypothetical protein [Weissella tructae]